MSRRIVFTFDERSMESLISIKERCRLSSLGEALRLALSIRLAIANQQQQGFTELVVRNPETAAERIVVLP